MDSLFCEECSVPRPCSVCKHINRSDIDAVLDGSLSLRVIAKRWGVSKTSLLRHRQKCVGFVLPLPPARRAADDRLMPVMASLPPHQQELHLNGHVATPLPLNGHVPQQPPPAPRAPQPEAEVQAYYRMMALQGSQGAASKPQVMVVP